MFKKCLYVYKNACRSQFNCYLVGSSCSFIYFVFCRNMVLFFIHSIQDQKLPGPPAYIFMIDVSYQSVQCGMVRMLMKELKELLDVLPK